ncbi:MAG: hypothetical protein CMH54_10795 [Myxococcales bacterium]|nr:hypothetical protein [Myxococcales bacterium]
MTPTKLVVSLMVLIMLAPGCGKKGAKKANTNTGPSAAEIAAKKSADEQKAVAVLQEAVAGSANGIEKGLYDQLTAAYAQPPSDGKARTALAELATGLDDALILGYVQGSMAGSLDQPSDFQGVITTVIDPALALVTAEEAAETRTKLEAVRSRLESLAKHTTDLDAALALAGVADSQGPTGGAQGDLATAMALRVVLSTDAALKAASPEEAHMILRGLACPQCATTDDLQTLLDVVMPKGGLGCSAINAERAIDNAVVGCSMPNTKHKLPAILKGRMGPRSLIMARAFDRLAKLAVTGETGDPRYQELKKKVVKLVTSYTATLPPEVLRGETSPAKSPNVIWMPVSAGTGAPAAAPERLLLVDKKGVYAVQSPQLGVGADGSVTWTATEAQKLVGTDLLALEGRERKGKIAKAGGMLKHAMAEKGAPSLVISGDTRPDLLSAATEILNAANIYDVHSLALPTDESTRSLSIWLTDVNNSDAAAEKPPHTSWPTVRLKKEHVILQVGTALSDALKALETEEPLPFETKSGKDGLTVILPLGTDGAAPEQLVAALDWLETNTPLEGIVIDARNEKPVRWQRLLTTLVHGKTDGRAERKIALRIYVPPKKKIVAKPKPEPKPKPEARPLGFCKKSDIEKVRKKRAGAFRFCYERELQARPELQGKLSVRFTIAETGKVDGAKITKNTLPDKRVGKCVVKNIRKLRFKKPEGGICVVNWPFTFKSSQ